MNRVGDLVMLPLVGDGRDLVEHVKDLRPLTDLVLPQATRVALDRIMAEHYQRDKLMTHGLRPANRILFCGPPGCGKTAAAGGVALALPMPLALLRLDGIIRSFLGSTAESLRKVFDVAKHQRVVLFLDEIDAIGRARATIKEGDNEMQRVVNSLLIMLEEITGPSLVIAATNHEVSLDPALWRRFDEVVMFPAPSGIEAAALLKRLVDRHDQRASTQWAPPTWRAWPARLAGMSFADIERLAMVAAKSVVLDESLSIEVALLAALKQQRARQVMAKSKQRSKR